MTNNQKIAIGVTIATVAFIVSYYGALEVERINNEKNLLNEYNRYISSYNAFYPGTTINGIDVKGLTPDEVLKLFEEDINNKSIYIDSVALNASAKFNLKDLNIDYKGFEEELNKIYNEQTFSFDEFKDSELIESRSYSYDIYKGLDFENIDFSNISFMDAKNLIDSQNAYIKVDFKNNSVSVEEEVIGNRLKDNVFKDKIIYAINNDLPTVIFDESDYIMPEITSSDASIQSELEYYESIFNKSISLTVCGIIDNLDKSKTRNFYSFSDDKVNVNKDKVTEYVKNLKASYDTYGRPRSFHTSTGKDVVIEKNLYGWEINLDKTVNAILDALNSPNERESISAVYNHTGQRYVLNEISNTYIEVSIDDQHVWMYKDGNCILSSVCVTGELTNPDMWTHKGVYYLINAATDCVLKGPDYRYDVSYWIFFDRENAIGFHDATWRDPSEFNENTYIGNGSHGCINLPLDVVANLYNNLSMDEPVIIW